MLLATNDARPGGYDHDTIVAAQKTHRVLEDEITEILSADQPVINQLMRLGQHTGHVANIEVTDIGTEQGIQLHAMRQVVPRECPGVHRVVRLATEIESVDELADQLASNPGQLALSLTELANARGCMVLLLVDQMASLDAKIIFNQYPI